MKKICACLVLLLVLFGLGNAQTAGHSVALTWAQSIDSATGNKIYRSLVSGGPYSLIFTCTTPCVTYTDTSVTAGGTFYYVVTSINGTFESGYSNEAKAVIPQAPPTSLSATPK